ARWTLFCKDWLRLRLTGEVATDASEASAYCTDVRTQAWSPEALELFGLADLAPLLPPVLPSAALAGEVTPAAAEETGLRPGTPARCGRTVRRITKRRYGKPRSRLRTAARSICPSSTARRTAAHPVPRSPSCAPGTAGPTCSARYWKAWCSTTAGTSRRSPSG